MTRPDPGTKAPYGIAEQLCVSKNVAVETLARTGIIESSGGAVRLLSRDEMPAGWIPPAGSATHVCPATQQLVRNLEEGEWGSLLFVEACSISRSYVYTTKNF